MAVYYGVVRDNRVEIEDSGQLADGVRVEVRPRTAAPTEDDTAADDILRAEGLLEDEASSPLRGHRPFEPVVVQGEPLSEQIIRERRYHAAAVESLPIEDPNAYP